jgi:hypothetical protein
MAIFNSYVKLPEGISDSFLQNNAELVGDGNVFTWQVTPQNIVSLLRPVHETEPTVSCVCVLVL